MEEPAVVPDRGPTPQAQDGNFVEQLEEEIVSEAARESSQATEGGTVGEGRWEEAKRTFYDFCSSTTFHGLDLIRREQGPLTQVFWVACAIAGLLAVSYVTTSMIGTYREEDTGTNQIVLEEAPGLGPVQICYDAFLPSRPDFYPPPHPDHVYAFLNASKELRQIVEYWSSLWFKSRGKQALLDDDRPIGDDRFTFKLWGKLRILLSGSLFTLETEVGSGGGDEGDTFEQVVYRDVRPSDGAHARQRESYAELLGLANASSFAALVLKLLPQARWPLVVHNAETHADKAHWTQRHFLLANQRQYCQMFTPRPDTKPRHLDLTLVFPPIWAVAIDLQMGKPHFRILDRIGEVTSEIHRPMAVPDRQIFPANSPRAAMAGGRFYPRPNQMGYFELPSATLRLTTQTFRSLSTQRLPCLEGAEAVPTARDEGRAHSERRAGGCVPMDELLLDAEDPARWPSVCDPFQAHRLEKTFLAEGSGATDAQQSPTGNQTWHHFLHWISREGRSVPGPTYCETRQTAAVAGEEVRRQLFSLDALLTAAFRDPKVRRHYAGYFREVSSAESDPQTKAGGDLQPYLLRVEMRGLAGDHRVTEQFLLLETGTLLAQLGGFVGLFMGASAVTLVHFLFYLASLLTPPSLQPSHVSCPGAFGCPSRGALVGLVVGVELGWRAASGSVRLARSRPRSAAAVLLLTIGACAALAYHFIPTPSIALKVSENKNLSSFDRTSFYNFSYGLAEANALGGAMNYYCKNEIRVLNYGEAEVRLDSPGYPGGYPNSLRCFWTFVAPGRRLTSTMEAFEVEDGADFVYVQGSNFEYVICTGTTCEKFAHDQRPSGCLEAATGCFWKGSPACSEQNVLIETLAFDGKGKRTTKGGVPCQRWSAQKPQEHGQGDGDLWKTGVVLQTVDNLCANVDAEQGPWCYALEPTLQWDFCYQDCGNLPAADHADHNQTQVLSASQVQQDACGTEAPVELEPGEEVHVRWPGLPASDLPRHHTCSWTFLGHGRALHLNVTPLAYDAMEDRVIVRSPTMPPKAYRLARIPLLTLEHAVEVQFVTAYLDPQRQGVEFAVRVGQEAKAEACLVAEKGCAAVNQSACASENVYLEMLHHRRNTTQLGLPCQHWAVNSPRAHSYRSLAYWDFGVSVYEAGNFCANPGDPEPRPWCFVAEGPKRWDFCLPECSAGTV